MVMSGWVLPLRARSGSVALLEPWSVLMSLAVLHQKAMRISMVCDEA